MELEESFRDTIENDIIKQQKENKKIKIKDIKLIGSAVWKDKINEKDLSDNVFIVEKEIIEIDENGKERIQTEIQEHIDNDCKPNNVKDFDGNKKTETHEHININYYVQEILNYKNEQGEEQIKEVFTASEVRDKLIRELNENENKLTREQIIENVKEEMNMDAEFMEREHKR